MEAFTHVYTGLDLLNFLKTVPADQLARLPLTLAVGDDAMDAYESDQGVFVEAWELLNDGNIERGVRLSIDKSE